MPEPTPVTRSRLPFVAIAVWAAILAAIVAVGLVFGGRVGGSQPALGAAGAPRGLGQNLNAPLAADPSASPGASTAPGTDPDNGGPKGPGGFAFGPGGRGEPGGPGGHGGPGRGPIAITAISGSSLSLKTDDGWTRTIDATGATVTEQSGTAITVADLKVGDQIGFRETRNTDGTYKITAITRIPPQAGGTVKTADATSATLTQPDGSTKTIGLTSATTYSIRGAAATAADLKVGTTVRAVGTIDASGNFTATRVDIEPAEVGGTVTAKTATTITIKDASGATVTVIVSASTKYETRGNNAAALSDVAVGNVLEAEGTVNSDGSLTATDVRFGAVGANAGPGGRGRGGPGFGRGGRGPGNGNGGNPANPASPAPSGSAT